MIKLVLKNDKSTMLNVYQRKFAKIINSQDFDNIN